MVVVSFSAKRPPLAYFVASVSVCCHLVAFLFYLKKHDDGILLSAVDVQVVILGTLLLAASVFTFAAESKNLSRFLYIIRLALVFALCYRFREWTEIRLLLIVALLFEIGNYEPFPFNLEINSAVIVTSFVGFEFFSAGFAHFSITDSTLFLVLTTTVGVTSSYITYFRERLIEKEGTLLRLNEAVSQLTKSNLMLQETAFHAAEQSKTSERQRVAREIHDTVGYTMTNLIMMMEAATDLVFDHPDELRQMMQAARDQAKSGLEETRRYLRQLRAYEDQPLKGLAAIGKLVSTYDTVESVNVEVEYGNAPMSFGEDIDSALFHFVQEGLTNALRHGRATNIHIRFWITDLILNVIIRDNGVGASQVNEGIGLAGMRERALRLNGRIEAKNVHDGFQVTLVLPLPGKNEGAARAEHTRSTRR